MEELKKHGFDELVREFLPHVFNFVYRLVGNEADAEDIVQEAFVKIWKHQKKYNAAYALKTWIFSIARNTAYDHLRKKKFITLSQFDTVDGNSLSDTISDPQPLPDELLGRVQEKELLESILVELSPSIREVLLLYYQEHLTFDEIGKILGKSINTIKSQHRRALIMLREKIENHTRL